MPNTQSPTGYLAITLHTHMPYVRKNGDWPCGEEWILEAWAECYLPFARLLRDLARGDATGRFAMTLTPVLAEQLADRYLQRRLAAYLENKMQQCMEETVRPRRADDNWKGAIACFYLETYTGLFDEVGSAGGLDLLAMMRRARKAGCLEVLASAATHGHLPLLPSDTARRVQVEVGLETYRDVFAGYPAGFWLPECAFAPGHGLAELLASSGLRYTVLHHSALAEGQSPARAYSLEGGPVKVLPVHPLPYDTVWARGGLPSHGNYRDYSKRDIEGHGLQYWRITSLDTPIEGKLPYEHEAALTRTREDAFIFVEAVAQDLARVAQGSPADYPPLIHACFDTELFGHWWYEGVDWLRYVLETAEAHPGLELVTPSGYLDRVGGAGMDALRPGETSWGLRENFYTWSNPLTQEMLETVRRCETRMREAASHPPNLDATPQRSALDQALRELLLLQSSDWPFMVTREQAADYARERFASHLERFERLLAMASGSVDGAALAVIGELDHIFPTLSFREYAI